MKKELLIGVLLIAVAAVALFIFRGPTGTDTGKDMTSSPAKAVTKKQIQPKKETDSKKAARISPAEQKKDSLLEDELAADEELAEAIEATPGVVALDRDLAKPIAMVNEVEVSLGDVMPPGILTPGEPIAEHGYNAYLNMAIDRQLTVQKAQEMGIMNSEEFQSMVETMRTEFEDADPQASKEDIDWEVNYFATSAVVNEVYRKEGLLPKKITKEEVGEYYDARSADYNWLREREKARGTSDDKIERKVQDQIKRDLRDPLSREAREKQRAYLDGLREDANIEYLK